MLWKNISIKILRVKFKEMQVELQTLPRTLLFIYKTCIYKYASSQKLI